LRDWCQSRWQAGLPALGWELDLSHLDLRSLSLKPGEKVQTDRVWVHVPLDDRWHGASMRVTLERREGRVSITELTIAFAGESIRPSEVFRQLGLADIGEAITGDMDHAGMPLPDWQDSFRDLPRVGRGRRPDAAYAVWAERYVDALAERPDGPVRLLVERYGIGAGGNETHASIRAKLNRARARGLLTPAPPGKPGGALTDKAQKLLSRLAATTED
jgi:hypothetical protein